MVDGRDGAYAWLVALSSYAVLFLHGGMVYSVGIIFIMLRHHIDGTDAQLTLVTSLNVGIIYAIGPVAGYLTDKFSERSVSMVGTVLASSGLACSYFATKVMHLYLTYSIMCGVGMGLAYNPAMTIINSYFEKWKFVAMGIAISGIGLGSFLFPPMIAMFESLYGWRGVFVMISALHLQTLVFCALFRPLAERTSSCTKNIRNIGKTGRNFDDSPRIKSNGKGYSLASNIEDLKKEKSIGSSLEIINVRNFENFKRDNSFDDISKRTTNGEHNHLSNEALDTREISFYKSTTSIKVVASQIGSFTILESKDDNGDTPTLPRNTFIQQVFLLTNRRYICLCIYCFIKYFAVITFFTFIGSFAISIGYTKSASTKLYMIMGISDMLSRPLLGVFMRVIGMNEYIAIGLTTLSNGILCAIIPFIRTHEVLYVLCAMSSSMMGCFNLLVVPTLAKCIPVSAIATGFGVSCIMCVPGTIFGAPIAAYLYESTSSFTYIFYLSSALFCVSGLVLVPTLPCLYNQAAAEEEEEEEKTASISQIS